MLERLKCLNRGQRCPEEEDWPGGGAAALPSALRTDVGSAEFQRRPDGGLSGPDGDFKPVGGRRSWLPLEATLSPTSLQTGRVSLLIHTFQR